MSQANKKIRKALKKEKNWMLHQKGGWLGLKKSKHDLREAQDELAFESHKRAELETAVMVQL